MRPLDERLFALLLHAYPREFRQRYADDLLEFFRHERQHPRFGTGALRPLRFWGATARDLAQTAAAERLPALSTLPALNRATLMRTFADHRLRLPLRLPVPARDAGRHHHRPPRADSRHRSQHRHLLGRRRHRPAQSAIRGSGPVDGDHRNRAADRPPCAGRLRKLRRLRERAGRRSNRLAASAYGPIMTTADPERPERLRSYRVSANLLDVLRVQPALGAGIHGPRRRDQ